MRPRVLVYGYGNPGRLDDGLGPALVSALSAATMGDEVTLETGYQLQVEDAALVAEHAVVVFADADVACAEPFELRPLEPRRAAAFSSHSVAPETLLALAREHFDCQTVGFVLGIRGYEWDEFGEDLSPGARSNLAAAADYVARALRDGSFIERGGAGPDLPGLPPRLRRSESGSARRILREAVGAGPGGNGHV